MRVKSRQSKGGVGVEGAACRVKLLRAGSPGSLLHSEQGWGGGGVSNLFASL